VMVTATFLLSWWIMRIVGPKVEIE
jgi:hypothetical protein